MSTVRNDPATPGPPEDAGAAPPAPPEGAAPATPAAPEPTMEGDIADAIAAQEQPAAPSPATGPDTPAGDGAAASPPAAVGAGDGEGAVESAAPPAPLPDHYDLLGHKLTPAQVEAALNVYAWASGLTPEQVQAVERSLNPEPAAAGVQPSAAPVAPAQPAEPDPYEDPAVADLRAQVAAQATALEQLKAQRAPEVDQQLLQQRTDVATDVMEKVRTTYDLNDAEQELLAQRVAASGMLPMYESQTGDFRPALEKAVEQQIWTDPYYREKAIAQRSAAQTAQEQTIEERKAASSALGGSTGSAPRQTAAPPRPTSRNELIEAMAGEIAAAQNGQ